MRYEEAMTLIDELVVSAYGEGRARAMLSVTLDPDGQARLRRKFEQFSGEKQKARKDILAALLAAPAASAGAEPREEE